MKVFGSITELVGGTPLLELSCRTGARIIAKLEYLNPCGSVKDRVAVAMIDDAERRGLLERGAAIVEPTSGNTGIALAAVAAARGYRMIVAMPDTMSAERRSLIAAYGAEIVLTDGRLGMDGAVRRAQELARELGAFLPGQFTNPVNPKTHYETTGPEIWRDTDGTIDILVAGVGTGGTVSGTGGYLKAQNPDIRVVAVEPLSSPVLSRHRAGAHGIQGIGAGFVPETLNVSVYDEVIAVSDADAFTAARSVARTDGVLVGISSGAALCAAEQLAARAENSRKTIVVVFPDSADRYYSTALFNKE